MPVNVASLVNDPEFQKLSPSDQQATLAQVDPQFGQLSSPDFIATVNGIQKNALSRPDLVTPPAPAGSGIAATMNGTTGDSGPTNYQPVAAEQTDAGHQAAVQQRAEAQPVINAAGQMAEGFVNTVGSHALNLDNLVRHGLNHLGANYEDVNPTDFGAKSPDALANKTGWQQAGGTAENVAEFMMGDAALKGLTVAKRLGLAKKVADLAEESPYVAKLLEVGMNGIRMGTTETGLGVATRDESLPEAATTGAITGTIGAGLEGIGAAYKGIKAAGGLKNAFSESAASKVGQDTLTSNIRGAASDVAGAEGVVPETSQSVRSAVDDAGNSVYGKAKGLFGEIDSATGGKFQPIENALQENQRALRGAVSDEEVSKLTADRALLQAKQEQIFQAAQANGVDKTSILQARATYKRASALFDLNKQIELTTTGVRPEDALTSQATPEFTDAKALLKRLNTMNNSGRLQEALGDTGAKKLINDVDAAMRTRGRAIDTARLNKNIAKYVGNATGIGAGGGLVYHFLK